MAHHRPANFGPRSGIRRQLIAINTAETPAGERLRQYQTRSVYRTQCRLLCPVCDPKRNRSDGPLVGHAASAPLLAVVGRGLSEAVDPPQPRQALELVLAGVLELEL
jgi:hypothetical protein